MSDDNDQQASSTVQPENNPSDEESRVRLIVGLGTNLTGANISFGNIVGGNLIMVNPPRRRNRWRRRVYIASIVIVVIMLGLLIFSLVN